MEPSISKDKDRVFNLRYSIHAESGEFTRAMESSKSRVVDKLVTIDLYNHPVDSNTVRLWGHTLTPRDLVVMITSISRALENHDDTPAQTRLWANTTVQNFDVLLGEDTLP